MELTKATYQKPTLVEYGDLRQLTESVANFGDEDGGAKQSGGPINTGGGFGNFSH